MRSLELKFLGEFSVLRDGRAMSLPPSRKTRALLAYLCLNRRRFRREYLCELLWEVPDDPRGSLRWSLSKLRRLLDDDDRRRIVADRSNVEIDAADVDIDVTALQALANNGLDRVPTDALEDAARRYAGNFLEGLEFSNFHDFHAWCVAERERSARAQTAVFRELVSRFVESPEQALPFARSLVGVSPYDEPSRAALIRLLVTSGRVEEADQHYQLGLRMLKEAGIVSSGALLQARRGVPDAQARSAAERAPDREPAGRGVPRSSELLLGRDEEAGILADTLGRVTASGGAEVLLVRGEPGIGKSRLLRYALDLAEEDDLPVLHASAFESESIRPFALWTDALRAQAPDAVDRVFGDGLVDNRDRLFASLSDLVAAESARGAVLLLFDDVQWSDESSAAALHYIVRMNRDRPIFAVLAARDNELRDNMPLQQALRGLRHDQALREIRLGPLPEAAISRLIEDRAPGADNVRLSRECHGNPLLAIELARAEAEGGSGGSLEQLVRERLVRFDVDGAEVLRWAAVVSPHIDIATLVALTGLDSSKVGVVLADAERQAILTSTDRGLRFSHELIARGVYADISPLRRQVMHRRVAESIEQQATLDPGHAADLAHHATQSGDPGLAARAMVSAGRLCLRFFANDEALALARRGLQLVEELPAGDRVRVSIDLHDVMLSAAPLDDWEAAARQYAELAEQALDHGETGHARIAYQMAAYVGWAHGHWAGAREQSLQSERVVRGGGDDVHVIGMAETAKCLVMLERDMSEACAMLMEAESLAVRKRIVHRSIPAGLGMLRFYENRLEEAQDLFEQTRVLCKSAGDRVNEYQANEYLVMIDVQQGRFAEANDRCEELLSIGDKLREGSEAPFARALRGLCIYALEDDATSLDSAVAQLRIADAKHRLAYVLTRAALLDCERDRGALAEERAVEALGYAQLLERATEMLLAHVVLACCFRSAGDASRSRHHEAEVVRLQEIGVAAWARDIAARFKDKGQD